jgi:hypothetical protein
MKRREDIHHVVPADQPSAGLIIDKVDGGMVLSFSAVEIVANACDKGKPV